MYPYVGPNAQLKTYQQAIREEMESRAPKMIEAPRVEMEIWFWRRIDRYRTPADLAARKHEADATNLQKGLEDALQGLLFMNDRVIADIRSVVVEQTADTKPLIIIRVSEQDEPDLTKIPTPVWNSIQNQPTLVPSNLHLANPEDIF